MPSFSRLIPPPCFYKYRRRRRSALQPPVLRRLVAALEKTTAVSFVTDSRPTASTRISRVSASQSTRISFTLRTCPLVSPFFHRRFRDRLKKMNLAATLGTRQRFRIQEPYHQDLSCAVILDDGRHNPASFSNASSKENLPKNKNPAGAKRASGLISAFVGKSSMQSNAGAAGGP